MPKNSCGKLSTNEENYSCNGNDSFDNSSSTAFISRDSNGSNKSNNIKNSNIFFKNNNEGFLGEKNKPNEKKIYKNQENDNLLSLQIKYALSKMREQYSVNKPIFNKTSNLNNFCEYYLGNSNHSNEIIYDIDNNEKKHNKYSFINNYNMNPMKNQK